MTNPPACPDCHHATANHYALNRSEPRPDGCRAMVGRPVYTTAGTEFIQYGRCGCMALAGGGT